MELARSLLILASFLAVCLAQQCYDAGDKLINKRCFKLVNQKLSFNDARNWCRYSNPVTPSNLASVLDQTTSTWLASYARTSFNVNEGYFWIGLSRPTASSRYQWDDGQPFVYSNFEQQNGGNYVAESITNGRWSTYSADAKLNFVCSYDPANPPTFAPQTFAPTEGTTTEYATTTWEPASTISSAKYSQCRLGHRYQGFTFFYSTDMSPSAFQRIRNTIFGQLAKRYYDCDHFSVARIDMKHQEQVGQPQNINSFLTYLDAHPPNASLAADPTVPSNLISIFQSTLYYNWYQNTICLFLINRLPSETDDFSDNDYRNMTFQNRQVFVIIPKSVINGDFDFGALQKLVAITNGHVIVVNDPGLSADYQADYDNIIRQIMEFSYNGNLMFSRSLGSKRLQENRNLGVLMVPESQGLLNIRISVTLSYRGTPSTPNGISFTFVPKISGSVGQNVTVTALENYHGSNFYQASVLLNSTLDSHNQSEFDVFIDYDAIGEDEASSILIRFWTTDDLIDSTIQFMGYQRRNAYPFTPNEFDGAMLSLQIQCFGGDAKLIITDCNGQQSEKYDARQLIPFRYAILDQKAFASYFFAPFFCDSSKPSDSTCIQGAESKYDVQLTSGRFTFVRSFFCDPGVGELNGNCTNLDENGNYYCTRNTVPYMRGPLGQLTDCLGRGFLDFDYLGNRVFRCICDEGFTGVSCESTI